MAFFAVLSRSSSHLLSFVHSPTPPCLGRACADGSPSPTQPPPWTAAANAPRALRVLPVSSRPRQPTTSLPVSRMANTTATARRQCPPSTRTRACLSRERRPATAITPSTRVALGHTPHTTTTSSRCPSRLATQPLQRAAWVPME